MSITLQAKLAQLPPERRGCIKAESERLHAEYRTLKDPRKAKALTRAQLAETPGIRRASIAQLETRSDLMLSTLRSHVEAMGGRLRLTVEFPDRASVSLDGPGDTDEPPPSRNRQSADGG